MFPKGALVWGTLRRGGNPKNLAIDSLFWLDPRSTEFAH